MRTVDIPWSVVREFIECEVERQLGFRPDKFRIDYNSSNQWIFFEFDEDLTTPPAVPPPVDFEWTHTGREWYLLSKDRGTGISLDPELEDVYFAVINSQIANVPGKLPEGWRWFQSIQDTETYLIAIKASDCHVCSPNREHRDHLLALIEGRREFRSRMRKTPKRHTFETDYVNVDFGINEAGEIFCDKDKKRVAKLNRVESLQLAFTTINRINAKT